MAPRQFPSRLLGNWRRGSPVRREFAHVLKVARRKPRHVRKFQSQIPRQTVDDSAAPTLLTLLGEDRTSKRPIQLNELCVDGAMRATLRVSHAPFELAEQLGVSSGERNINTGHNHILSRP